MPNIWRLGQATDSKFGTNVSNKKLLNATKCQGYSFYRFIIIKGKPKPQEIRVKLNSNLKLFDTWKKFKQRGRNKKYKSKCKKIKGAMALHVLMMAYFQ